MTPRLITFTGVDERTDLERCEALGARYPIEWGVLFSASRQGRENRYPNAEVLKRIRRGPTLSLAAHLCGAYARDVNSNGAFTWSIGVDLAGFQRVQVNHMSPDPAALELLRERLDREVVAQVRGGVRDADDWLDLDKCEAVCRIVFPEVR